MSRNTGSSRWVRVAIAILWGVIFPSIVGAVGITGWNSFKTGYIAGKGLVLGENRKPVWVEYDAEGEVVREIGEAHGEPLETAAVISAAGYRAYTASFRAIAGAHAGAYTILSRDEYLATAFTDAAGAPLSRPSLAPGTYSVVVRTEETRYPGLTLLLHESPLDLNRLEDIPEAAAVVLLGEDKRVLETSAVNIGYRTAFYTTGGEHRDQGLYNFDPTKDTLWSPIAGARVETALGDRPALSNPDGRYVAGYVIPPCPGFGIHYQNNVFVQLRFQNFNPKSKQGGGYWTETREGYDHCNGLTLDWSAFYEQEISNHMKHNFHIDVAMLGGMAELCNEARPGVGLDPGLSGVVPVEEATAYAAAAPAADDTDQGLLAAITFDDLEDTTLYVYRVSTDQRVGVQEGIGSKASFPFYGVNVVGEKLSRINYRMTIRGPRSFYKPGRSGMETWQSYMRADPALHSRVGDHLRFGEDVKLVMVNHTSGYVGTAIATVGHEGGLINFTADKISMRPPNLRITAERIFDVEKGLTKGDDHTNLISFEGAGLTSDPFIRITTEWYDWDGTLLPADLPGYTGRLAKVVAENTLKPDGDMAEFAIRPGRRTQVVKLPRKKIDHAHFYLHVSGQPTDKNPNFTSLGTGGGPLAYRPKHYVPIRVARYDEASSQQAREAWEEAKAAGQPDLPEPEPVYHWVYRPEMQFTLHDLTIEEKPARTHDDIEPSGCHLVLGDEMGVAAQIPALAYLLAEFDHAPLSPFGPDRELVFTLGDEEFIATIDGETHEMAFETKLNLTEMNLAPEDFLVMRLYQNGDEANALWEYGFVVVDQILIEKGDIPVAPGRELTLRARTQPANRDVTWTIVKGWDGEGEVKDAKAVDAKLISAGTDSTRVIVVPGEDTDDGWIIVRAADREMPNCYKDALVFVGCPACEEGECHLAGGGFVELASVDARFNLGKTERGRSAGDILLMAKTLGPEIYTPGALRFYTLAADVEALYDPAGALRQVIAPETFCDIVTLDEKSYELRYYRPGEMGEKTGGIYAVAPGATAFSTWRVRNPDAATSDGLELIQYKDGGDVKRYLYQWNEENRAWSLDRGEGRQIETRAEVVDAARKTRTVTGTLKDGDGALARKTRTVFREYPWGEEVVQTIVDPDAAALTTTTDYHTDEGAPGYGRVKSVTRPDGGWTYTHYNSLGHKTKEVRGWLDSPLSPDEGVVTTYDYDVVDETDPDLFEDRHRPRTVTETLNGIPVSKTCYLYKETGAGERVEIVERCAHATAAYGDPGNLRTVRVYYPVDGVPEGRIKTVTTPDNRLTTYTYERGTYESGLPGAFSPGDGADTRETVVHGAAGQPEGLAHKTTRERVVRDRYGREKTARTEVFTGAGYELLDWRRTYHDEDGRVSQTRNANGAFTDQQWGCCGKTLEVDTRGIARSYFYDELQRVEMEERDGPGGPVVTTYGYDAAGRVTTTTVKAGALTQETASRYDGAGRLETSTDAAGLTTTHTYENGGRVTSVTRPGGATEITERHPDGNTRQITGTGVIPRYFTYGVNADGTRWTTVHTGAPESPRWEKTTTDFLGRTIRTERPGYTGTEVTEHHYDDTGRLVKTTTPGRADTLYAYDALGNQTQSGLDMDHNGALDPAGTDRITGTDTRYVKLAADWWQESVQRVYATAGSDAATAVSTRRTQVSGLGGNGKIAESVALDIHGNETRSRVTLDRGAKTETRIIDYPDSAIDAETVTVNGYLIESQTKTGVRLTYAYDALGRRTGITDPRTGATVTHYNDKGQVDYIEDPAQNRTTFAYDEISGRKTAETNALSKTTRYAYNLRGQVTRTWGDAAYPVAYDYDNLGRMARMRTYRADAGFTGESFPEGAAGDETAWQYHPATGLLTAKIYADTSRTAYTYGDAGRLATRTWARTPGANPLITTYTYDPDTGELSGIDYSDETPDIGFTYDRLGRQETVTDAVGTRTFAYNDALQLETEAVTGLMDATLTRTYGTSGVTGRTAGLTLGAGYTVTYGYDAAGRFETLGWQIGESGDTATYAYVADSDLLASISTGAGQITTFGYEPNRNLKTSVENAYNTALVSRYQYQYDPVGRKTSVTNSGGAFTTAAFNRYDYNDKNELTESKRYQGTDITNLTTPVDPETRLYAYDPIGNRNTATEGAESTSYVANQLNQYDEITTGGDTASLSYDADGNLTAWDGKILTYNAENRLIAVTPETPAESDKKLEFIYDFMGRRIQKTVSAYSAGAWTPEKEIYFVYDGWNVVQEKTIVGESTEKYYVWGLDLSQSLQGAGGIGGLIAAVDGSLTYQYLYDANGNVGQMVNAADGAIAAHYEYDPFGNEIVASGPIANDNPYRFSSKYWDNETGLGYWGYRYYCAELGIWVNRDPLGIIGSINLYSYVEQNPINTFDPIGLTSNIGIKPGPLGIDPSAHPVFQEGTLENDLIKKDIEKIIEVIKDTSGLKGWLNILVLLAKHLDQSEIKAIPEELIKEKTGRFIILFHGTDICSAISILKGAPLSVTIAIENKYKPEGGITRVGFYLTPNYLAAEYFALRREPGAVIQFNFTGSALSKVVKAGSIVQPIPAGGLPQSPGTELIVLPTAFPMFNNLRSSGQITVTPFKK